MTSVSVDSGNINFVIEKELGVEIVGETKIKIEVEEDEEPWDEIVDDEIIDKELNDNYLEESI